MALDAVANAGGPALSVRFGDAGLIHALLAALDLSPQWRRRILRGHAQEKTLDAVLATATSATGPDHSGVLAALEGADKQGARALVEDLLAIAGISTVGGRTPAEIAERFLEQAALKSGAGFPVEQRSVLDDFLAIEADPDEASARLRKLAVAAHLDIGAALDRFDARLGFLAARGIDIAELRFATRFARNLDYYTGFAFEAAEDPDGRPVIGGGRYDGLLRSLGAPTDVPAVGAAIFVERLTAQTAGLQR